MLRSLKPTDLKLKKPGDLMKMLLIALLTITSTSVFAASKDILNCQSKYERFAVSVDENNIVTIEKGTWERENGMSATRKIAVRADELTVLPKGLSFSVNARQSSHITITMDEVLNNDNNVVELNLKADNDSTLEVLNESLEFGVYGLSFFADECVFLK